jgi:hypothetical protein
MATINDFDTVFDRLGPFSTERIVPCEACGSEGRILRGQYEDERDCGPCPHCEGTGGEIIETQPIELADYECQDCIGMIEHGCYCKAVGAVAPGGPIADPHEECGRWDNGRLVKHCRKAGSEDCAFCPYARAAGVSPS